MSINMVFTSHMCSPGPPAQPRDLRPSGSGKVAPEGSALSSFSKTFLSRKETGWSMDIL